MGTIIHDAIIVTGFPIHTRLAHAKAQELGLIVTSIAQHATNGKSTFLIAPDGSKLGWKDSKEFDARRAQWIDWVRQERDRCFTPPFPDDAVLVEWVEVNYGDCKPIVVASSDGDADAEEDV